jgi:hypothetical protein
MANLFIGMGGSGLKTLVELRNRNRKDKNGKKIDHFLFVDTDAGDLQPFDNHEKIDLSSINVTSYLNESSITDPIRKAVDDWLDDKARLSFKTGPLSKGASANRPQGRLTIAKMANEFKSKIKSTLESTGALGSGTGDKEILHIYIVLSVAGGTGSSIYLDLTQIIYDVAFERLGESFFRPHVVLFLPDAFVNFQDSDNIRQYKTNVFAFWKEINVVLTDYFDSIDPTIFESSTSSAMGTNTAQKGKKRSTRFHDFAVISDKSYHERYAFQVFNDAMLIDQRNINYRSIELPQLYKNVARLLEMTTGEYGTKIRSHLDNSVLKFAAQSFVNHKNWIKQYWSAGFAEIKGGSEFFRNYVKANIKLEVYNAFYGEGASKIDASSFVKPVIQKYILSRIERSGVEGFDIVPFERENSILNIHSAIDTYWNSKFNSNFTKILKGIEGKNYVDVADRLKKLYENDFQNLSTNLEKYLSDGDKENKLLPFRLNLVIDDILNDTFKALCEIVYSKGLFSLSHALEYFDDKIDDFELEYEKRLKELSSKKSIVTIDDNVIINQNLAEAITTQYKKIKDGPGTWDKITGRNSWYETELTILKNLIKAQFDFVSEELAIKWKKDISHRISHGKAGEMPSRNNLKKLISNIKNRIESKDGGVKYNAHQNIKSQYNAISENEITFVIPDVTKFAELDSTGESTYNDPKINIFKRIFEEECGLAKKASKISKEESSFIRETFENADPDLKTMEDILIEVFNDDAKSLLPRLLNGTIESSRFCLEFDKLIEERLLANLETILTSANKNKKYYSAYANMKLEDWIKTDPESFERIRPQFVNKSSVFCYLKDVGQSKQLWLSDDSLKSYIDMLLQPNISTEDAKNNPLEKTWQKTDEDAIILINHLDDLGFDNYRSFDNYMQDYKINLSDNSNQYYPHIDVRFKNAMLKNNNINYPENHRPLLAVMESISASNSKSQTTYFPLEHEVSKYLRYYFRAYFLLKLFEKLNIEEFRDLYSSMVRYRSFENSPACMEESNNIRLSPVYQKDQILVILRCPNYKANEANGKILFDESTSNVSIDILTKTDFENAIIDKNLPESWKQLYDEDINQGIITFCLRILQRGYSQAIASNKSKLRNLINESKQDVLEEFRSLSPNDTVANKNYFLKSFQDFSKEINSLI